MPDELARAVLAECEAVIEHGLQTFRDVGAALLRIREEELFRPEYESFTQYCEKRWGWKYRTAVQQLRAAEVVRNFESCARAQILPEFEAQVRPLTRLEPEQQVQAWNRAVEQFAPNQPTLHQVEDIVRTEFEHRLTKAEEATERREREARERVREAEERAEQLYRERREAEARVEQLLKERDDVRVGRLVLYSGLIEAVKRIANFHIESAADAWDGISSARGNEDFLDYLDKAQRCLTRLKSEHPNAVRKPGIILKKLS